MEKKSFRVDELAHEWDVADRTIRRLIERGDLEAVKVGDTWRIKREEIEKYERQNSSRSKNS